MKEAKTLAEGIAKLRYEDLPETAVWAAKQRVLNWLGAALHGSQEQPARILRDTVLPTDGATDATLFGTNRQRAAATHAAFLNGAAAGSDEKLAALVSPAFSVAEKEHKSGRELLAAIVAGAELAARLGEVENSAGKVAAASAARALGLSPERTAQALCLADAQTAGVKGMLRAGKACYDGVLFAYLAQAGFTDGTEETGCGAKVLAAEEPCLAFAADASAWEESRARFLALAVPVLGDEKANRLAAWAETLDEAEDVSATLREIL